MTTIIYFHNNTGDIEVVAATKIHKTDIEKMCLSYNIKTPELRLMPNKPARNVRPLFAIHKRIVNNDKWQYEVQWSGRGDEIVFYEPGAPSNGLQAPILALWTQIVRQLQRYCVEESIKHHLSYLPKYSSASEFIQTLLRSKEGAILTPAQKETQRYHITALSTLLSQQKINVSEFENRIMIN